MLLAGEAAAGLGVVGAQLRDHVGEVLVVDPADPLQIRHLAAGQQVEIGDQPRHRRVVAVGGLGLEGNAFLQAARRRRLAGSSDWTRASAASASPSGTSSRFGDDARAGYAR